MCLILTFEVAYSAFHHFLALFSDEYILPLISGGPHDKGTKFQIIAKQKKVILEPQKVIKVTVKLSKNESQEPHF